MSDSAARPDTAAWHVFAAAGVAAAVELSVMQPLDVVKTRLQLQSSQFATADRYSGTWHALRSIHAAEGAAGLWRGFGTGLAIVIPRRGLKFAFNDFFKSVLQPRRGATERPSFHCNLAAGGLAGACEAVLITPLEVIKVAMQSEPNPNPNPNPSPNPNPNPKPKQVAMQSERAPQGTRSTGFVRVARAAAAQRGLLSGMRATVAKHSCHSCVYFATFAELQARIRASPSPCPSPSPSPNPTPTPTPTPSPIPTPTPNPNPNPSPSSRRERRRRKRQRRTREQRTRQRRTRLAAAGGRARAGGWAVAWARALWRAWRPAQSTTRSTCSSRASRWP